MDRSSRRSASDSAATCSKALLRWLISITDAPPPCQSISSARACSSTSSGSMAGPGEKLKARTAERLGAGGRRAGAAARFAVRAAGSFVRGIPSLDIPGIALGRQTVDALESGELIAVLEPDQTHPLSVAAHDGDVLHRRAHQNAVLAHEHDFVVGADLKRAYHAPIAVGDLQCNHALAAPAVLGEFVERRQLSETVLRRRENEALFRHDQRI